MWRSQLYDCCRTCFKRSTGWAGWKVVGPVKFVVGPIEILEFGQLHNMLILHTNCKYQEVVLITELKSTTQHAFLCFVVILKIFCFKIQYTPVTTQCWRSKRLHRDISKSCNSTIFKMDAYSIIARTMNYSVYLKLCSWVPTHSWYSP